MDQQTLEIVLRILLMVISLIGLISLIIPGFPGLAVIWLAMVGYGIATGIQGWDWAVLGVSGILMVAGNLADNVLMGGKALNKGASWLAVILALLAGLAGSILLPPLGGIPAALLVLFLVEWIRRKDAKAALSAVFGMAVGYGWGFIARVTTGIIMMIIAAVWVF
jgi:uncharacterized protein YqgC (DUF456 family)